MVKYYSYNEYVPDDEENKHQVVTKSEDEIIEQYYPYWYSKMCDKFGKDYVDANYNKFDCIDDWVVIHWAWEST